MGNISKESNSVETQHSIIEILEFLNYDGSLRLLDTELDDIFP